MIVIMEQGAGSAPTDAVVRTIESHGLGAHVFHGAERDVIAILGTGEPVALGDGLRALAGVERVEATTRAFKLASRDVSPAGTRFQVGTATVGDGLAVVVGTARPGPAGTLLALARAAQAAGATVFWVGRGTGGELRRDLISALDEIRSSVGLPVLVDIWDPSEVDRLSRHADALQVPAPQMGDVPLIRAAGQGDRPVVICRGPAATIEEWLLAAERVLQEGNRKVALVEQGVRTFETSVQGMLDLNAVAVARRLSHVPVLANPSLAAGQAEIVADLALAAAATGCDGVVLDASLGSADDASAHHQALPMPEVARLIERLRDVRAALSG